MKETVSRKECVKYTLEVSQMGQTAQRTVCVWQGFPMKTVTRADGRQGWIQSGEIERI